MLGHELADSSLVAQILYQVTRRRYRGFTVTVIALILLLAVWICSDLAVDSFRQLPFDIFRSDHQTQRISSQKTSGSKWETQNPTADTGSLIPPKIWQILLPKKQSVDNLVIDPNTLQDTASWLAMNTDYTYTLVGQKGANDFVQHHFTNEPRIVEAYNSLPNVGMQSDLLRYLILAVEGGVYTDTDTVALKPIDKWVPPGIRDQVRLIVGIEFDRRNGSSWVDIPHELQFGQWTIAAAPGHPVFRKMVDRVLQSVNELSEIHGLLVDQLHPTSFEVMNSTGPAAWTDVVFEQLQEYDPTLNTTRDLSFMTAPKLYGDILVLTIDGFGMGQPHSHSTNDGTIPDAALMRHLFRGSWRGDAIDSGDDR